MAKDKEVKPSFISAALIQKEAASSVTKTDPVKEQGILFGTDMAKAKLDPEINF